MKVRPQYFAAIGSAAAALAIAWISARGHAARAVDEPPEIVAGVNEYFERQWKQHGLSPAKPADELTVFRRMTLALCGTAPSLEEVRAFESDRAPQRLLRWVDRLMSDERFHRYFAERLVRAYVGASRGPFIVYRRDRFVDWLSERLEKNEPYDSLVRSVISSSGLWTDEPATNFITAAVVEGHADNDWLAGRTLRAFLGQRMDCAQCHDHPFAEWTQKQFKGVAAFYSSVEVTPFGVVERASTSTPAVPFGDAWLPAQGEPRARLAAWVTDPRNHRFGRAAVNRIWGLLFGRPYLSPVDDVPAAVDGKPDLLDLLAGDFVGHGFNLRRLIAAIALSEPFCLSSDLGPSADRRALESAWAVFPLTPLRSEQIVGALLQAASARTIDPQSHLVVRAVRALREKAFVEEYGETVDDELAPRAGTVPQALLRMNGKLPQEIMNAQPFGAVGRIASFSSGDGAALEGLYLAFLSRRPTPEERARLEPVLAGTRGKSRGQAAEDISWGLFNSPEFAWNH